MCDDDIESLISVISTKINKIFWDREFVSCVREDLDIVLNNSKNCVLFPKLKPIFLKVLRYQAFLCDLSVLYIGSGLSQVVVVCKKLPKEQTDECPSVSTKGMDPEENSSKSSKKKCSRMRPTQSYYVPPAQRPMTRKEKPKADTEQVFNKTSSTSTREELTWPILGDVATESSHSSQSIDISVILEKNESFELSSSLLQNLKLPYEEINKSSETNVNPNNENDEEEILNSTLLSEGFVGKETVDDTVVQSVDTKGDKNLKDEIVNLESSYYNTDLSKLYISYNDEVQEKSSDCDTDNEKEEMKRALKNINRKRRPLLKNMHDDDTLWINENKLTTKKTNFTENEKNNAREEQEIDKEDVHNIANWEDLFDENGDLHHEYVGEIVKEIGCEVNLLKASHDYSDYEAAKYQDLEHVVELYDFPPSLKTQDIMQLYRAVSQNSMYVKWCDDTHCLLVLSSPVQAKRALQIQHDIIKSRPLTAASAIATCTAGSSDLKPAMQRPQTNMQTARRLINTHLGTKSSLSKEEVELERKALRDAREQRRLEKQNEKDAWEGRLRNTK